MRVPEISLDNELQAQNGPDFYRYYKYKWKYQQTQYPTVCTVSFMVVPSVRAWGFRQKKLLRSLMNVRPPRPIGEDFLAVQDKYLQEETARKGVTDITDLSPVEPGIYLWQGDITTLKCGAIVNAANGEISFLGVK